MNTSALLSDIVRFMNFPDELRYSSDHEWVRLEGVEARMGITDYAQDALGDIVFIQLPEVGSLVATGASFSEVESTKSVSDVYAPIAGTVVAVNDKLTDEPQCLNDDPYGDGWICLIAPSSLDEVSGLLDADAYRALVDG